ncbi:hypothetical protein Syun_022803 [Stephania yunnanensis]|uniref:Peptidase S54 rhomboid domain-containing protein n=1 Tax=Stephania yunnanensis TaxID=152371 RepID=A0AAP0FAD0_9MAGN
MNTLVSLTLFSILALHGDPIPAMRSWFPSAEGTVWRLIAANAAVFMLWRVADPSFMRRNFTISVENFRNGRIHTLITAAFSHIEIEHLLSNMIGLYFFGNSIGINFLEVGGHVDKGGVGAEGGEGAGGGVEVDGVKFGGVAADGGDDIGLGNEGGGGRGRSEGAHGSTHHACADPLHAGGGGGDGLGGGDGHGAAEEGECGGG